MAITRTGNYFENGLTGNYGYGAYGATGTSGNLVIDSASVLALTGSDGPNLSVGVNAGNTGTATITGAGSELTYTVPAAQANGSTLSVGINGGNGTLSLLAGARFTMVDSANTTGGPNGDGNEYAAIGRHTGSVGVVNVNASDFFASGTGANFNIGRQNGTGTLNVSNLGSFILASTGTDASNAASLRVGRDGGNGTLNVTNGLVAVQGAANGDAQFTLGSRVGSDTAAGNGTATLIGTAGMLQGLVVMGGSNTQFASALIGAGTGATGNLTMQNALLIVNNNGNTLPVSALDPALSQSAVEGMFSHTGAGGDSYMALGRDGGTGTITATGGMIGVFADNFSNLVIGVNGGTGTVNASGGAAINVNSGTSSRLYVSDGGTGTLNISGSSTLNVSGAADAEMHVGENGGTGSLTATTSTLRIESGGDGGNPYANLIIGSFGGTGTVTLDDSDLTLMLQGAQGGTGIVLGHSFGRNSTDAGHGTLILRNGATILEDGGLYDGNLEVGGGAGSSGVVEVRSGSSINLGGTGYMQIGGVEAGATGSVLIDGAGSTITGYMSAWIGRDIFNPGAGSVGTGSLTLTNGGSIGSTMQMDGSPYLSLSQGGTLFAGQGVVNGSLDIYDGVLDLRGNGLSTLTVNGRLNTIGDNSQIFMEVGASGSDQIVATDHIFLGDPGDALTFTVAAASGYQFTAGAYRNLVVAGNIFTNDANLTVNVLGQASGFAYTLGESASLLGTITLTALNSGSSGGAAVLDIDGSVGQSAGYVYFDTTTRIGSVYGGRFSDDFGAYFRNVTTINGTSTTDVLVVTGSTSGGAGVIFNGRGGSDILTGGAAADVLDGGDNTDTLDGGAGVDQLFGGNGDDTILFDAADDLANVLGGADYDTLRVVSQPVPTAFDLTAHQFERANVLSTDTAGAWWSSTSDYYNTSWQRTNADIFADDGRLVQTTYDVSPGGTGQNWQFITDYRNPAGVLTNQDGKFDIGMLFSKSFDYAAGTGTDGISDELREFTYFFRNDSEKAANMVANVEGFYDDGRKFTQTNDVDANQLWSFQTNWYKTDGVTLDFLEIHWDDGHTTITPY